VKTVQSNEKLRTRQRINRTLFKAWNKTESYHGELFNSSSSALASFKSAVSKPSVNQP
jgi:hypothetical protein